MRPEFPDAGTYLGVDRVGEYMRGFLEPCSADSILFPLLKTTTAVTLTSPIGPTLSG